MVAKEPKLVLLKFLSVSTGLLLVTVSSSSCAINFYANSLKARFNYTQSEVELSTSFINVGSLFGLPVGLVLDRCGPRASLYAGLVLGVLGYGLLWMSTLLTSAFAHLSGLVAVFHLIAGLGMCFLYVTPVAINLKNVKPRHRSKLTSLLSGSYLGGSAILSAIYQEFFVNGHVMDPQYQDVGSFFLLLVALVAVLCVVGLFTLRDYSHSSLPDVEEIVIPNDMSSQTATPPEINTATERDCVPTNPRCTETKSPTQFVHEKTIIKNQLSNVTPPSEIFFLKLDENGNRLPPAKLGEITPQLQNTSVPMRIQIAKAFSTYVLRKPKRRYDMERQKCQQRQPSPQDGCLSILHTMRSADVLLALCQWIFTGAVHLSFLTNTTMFLRSLSMDEHILFVTSVLLIISTAANFLIASLADFLHGKFKVRISFVIMFLSLLVSLSHLFLTFFMDRYELMVVFTFLSITAGGAVFSLTPVLLSRNLPTSQFARTFGIFLMIAALLCVFIQKTYGFFYDSNVDLAVGHDCLGKHCLVPMTILNAALTFCSVLSGILLIFRRKW